ncbi:MAG: cupin domain-containing protein [Saprospiraceae bacterium]|nr:cupin domain-containing protein [Saprospiraceae bacterium]
MNDELNIKPTRGFFLGEETEWEEVAPGLSRQIMGYDDKIMLVKAKFETGAIGVMHKHYHSQVTYVESGEFEMTIGDDVKILKKGDSFYILPWVMHGCVCTQPGILVDVFSPAREDFLGYPMQQQPEV